MIPSAYGRTVGAGATDRFTLGPLPQGTRVKGFYVVAAPPDAAAAVDALLSVRIGALQSVSQAGDNSADAGDSLMRGEATADAVRIPVRTQVLIPCDMVAGEYSITCFQVSLTVPGATALEVVVSPIFELPGRKSGDVEYKPLNGR